MKCFCLGVVLCLLVTATALPGVAQEAQETPLPASVGEVSTDGTPTVSTAALAELQVPRLVKLSGALRDALGQPRTGVVGITFAIYQEQEGGAPLWLETQNAELDEQGRYTVLLGAESSEGLPLEIFSTTEARWLGVTVQGEEEQPRVLLVSVPYALKAADANTLGGKPASAFVLSETVEAGSSTSGEGLNALSASSTTPTGEPSLVTAGTPGRIAKFVNTTDLGDSALFELSGNIGLGTTSPTQKLDVSGAIRSRGGTVFLQRNLTDQPGRRNWVWGTETFNVGDFSLLVSTANDNDPTVARFTILSGGEVGIGTTSPTHKLDVSGAIRSREGTVFLQRNLTDQPGRRNWAWGTETFNVGDFSLLESTANNNDPTVARFTILSGGNVGIGTTSPGAKLDVAGTVKATNLDVVGAPGTAVLAEGVLEGLRATSTGTGAGSKFGVLAFANGPDSFAVFGQNLSATGGVGVQGRAGSSTACCAPMRWHCSVGNKRRTRLVSGTPPFILR